MRKLIVGLVGFVVACGVGQRYATGDSIVVWGTGLDNYGQLLTPGTGDPHYQIVATPPTYQIAAPPITPEVTSNNPLAVAWADNTSTSQWINPTGNGSQDLPVGYYTYQTTFDLSGFAPSTAVIEGNWAVDNSCEIYLNGQSTGVSLPFGVSAESSLNPFTITTGFIQGINTLTFPVYNVGDIDNPTGIQVQITSATADPTPEPSTLALLGVGAIGLLGYAWRKRKRNVV